MSEKPTTQQEAGESHEENSSEVIFDTPEVTEEAKPISQEDLDAADKEKTDNIRKNLEAIHITEENPSDIIVTQEEVKPLVTKEASQTKIANIPSTKTSKKLSPIGVGTGILAGLAFIPALITRGFMKLEKAVTKVEKFIKDHMPKK